MSTYIHIGRFVATFGIQGELILKHVLAKKIHFKKVEAIFVEEVKNTYLPYFIETAKPKNEEEVLIQLEGIKSKEAAHLLVYKNVWLQETDFRQLAGKMAPISLLGFTIINKGVTLATIEEVIEQPRQILTRITLNNKEVLIPLHQDSLLKIDYKTQQVIVNLPDGLLDVYLE